MQNVNCFGHVQVCRSVKVTGTSQGVLRKLPGTAA